MLRTGGEREETVVADGPRERRAQTRAHPALDLNEPALDEAVRRRRNDALREAHQLVRRREHSCAACESLITLGFSNNGAQQEMNPNYEVVETRNTFDHVNFGGLRLVGRRRSWRRRFAHGFNYYSICDWALGHSKQRYAFEALLEVRLNSQWVRRLRQNLEQLVVRQEEEPREYQALLLEILV